VSIPDEYDVDKETDFNRDKLQTAIPQRLQELLDIITSRKKEGREEDWFAGLVYKLLLSVDRVCGDLLRTMEHNSVSGAAWNARNLLELWIWLKYCAASRENARRFHEDALRDMQGITEALSRMHADRGIPNEFESSARLKLAEVAREEFGLDSVDGSYLHVAEAAKAIGVADLFGSTNKFLSKFSHPTAGLVIGIMHQYEAHRRLQATMTTTGVYFAGQCTIVLGEIVEAMPS
jgi:hypothetical protein